MPHCGVPSIAVTVAFGYTTVGFQLLPEKFTLVQLQEVYEAILGKKLDKRNLRRKMAMLKILKPLDEYQPSARRPVQLFRFVASRFEKLRDKGILFTAQSLAIGNHLVGGHPNFAAAILSGHAAHIVGRTIRSLARYPFVNFLVTKE